MGIDDLSDVFHIGESIYSSQTFPIMYRTWDEYAVTLHFNSNPEFCLVAESNGKVAGYIMATIIEKSKSAWKYGYIVWLGVRKYYQRTGVANRLYNAIEEKFKDLGVRIVLADIEGTNHRALDFFRKKKFERAAIYI